MKKHILLAVLAILAVGSVKLQALTRQKVTVKNNSGEPIFAAISHTKCKLEADFVGYSNELTSKLGDNLRGAEELKDAAKNFAAGVKAVKGTSKDCEIKYILAGKSADLSSMMPGKWLGIGPSGFSVHIGDEDGKWILKEKDVKFGQTATWDGKTLKH